MGKFPISSDKRLAFHNSSCVHTDIMAIYFFISKEGEWERRRRGGGGRDRESSGEGEGGRVNLTVTSFLLRMDQNSRTIRIKKEL